MKRILFILTLALVALAGCKKETPEPEPIAVKVSQIKLVGMPTTDFNVGRSVTISAVITPDDATDKSVTFTSSNPEVATVEYTKSENNYSLALLKAVGPGKATITATANDGSGVKAEAEVDVLPAPKMVSQIKLVGMPTTEFTVGRSVTISAVITPDDATDKSVTFTSSNPEVATVEYTESENNYSLALLKAVGPGKATITATANDGSGVKAEAEVTVIPNVDESYYVTFKSNLSEFKISIPQSEKGIYKIEGATVTNTHDFSGIGTVEGSFLKNYKNTELTLKPTTVGGEVKISGKITGFLAWKIGLTEVDASHNKALELLYIPRNYNLQKLEIEVGGDLKYLHIGSITNTTLKANAQKIVSSLQNRTGALYMDHIFTDEQRAELTAKGWTREDF